MTDYKNSDKYIPNLPKLPEIKFQKNGFEIRSDVLKLAKEFVDTEFSNKYMGWEFAHKDQNGKMVTTVKFPDVPGIDKVLEAAEKFYAFVNKK